MGVPDATGNKCHAAPTIVLSIPTSIWLRIIATLYTLINGMASMDSRKRERGKGKNWKSSRKQNRTSTYFIPGTTTVCTAVMLYVMESTRSGGDGVLCVGMTI